MSVAMLVPQSKEEYQQILKNQNEVSIKIMNYLKKTSHNKKV